MNKSSRVNTKDKILRFKHKGCLPKFAKVCKFATEHAERGFSFSITVLGLISSCLGPSNLNTDWVFSCMFES